MKRSGRCQAHAGAVDGGLQMRLLGRLPGARSQRLRARLLLPLRSVDISDGKLEALVWIGYLGGGHELALLQLGRHEQTVFSLVAD